MAKVIERKKQADLGLVGSFKRFGKRFGPHGVAYQVLEADDAGTATVRVFESGETLEYPIGKVPC